VFTALPVVLRPPAHERSPEKPEQGEDRRELARRQVMVGARADGGGSATGAVFGVWLGESAAGRGLGLWGHGLRERQQRGPLEVGGAAPTVVIRERRYRCRGCGALLVVVPRGVLRGRHYSASAIGLALALFGVVGMSLAEVRRRVSPWPVVGERRGRRGSRCGAGSGRFASGDCSERCARHRRGGVRAEWPSAQR
jgi:hypothetical protein